MTMEPARKSNDEDWEKQQRQQRDKEARRATAKIMSDDSTRDLKIRGEYAREGMYANADGTTSKQPEYRREWAKGQMRVKVNEKGESRYTVKHLTPLNFLRMALLFVLNWIGLFVAGGIFVALEAPAEKTERAAKFKELEGARAEIAALILSGRVVANAATAANATYAMLDATQLASLERFAAATAAAPRAEPLWDFWHSVYFSLSIATTIGYGVIAPATTGGRCFTIFYAVVGVGLLGYTLVWRWRTLDPVTPGGTFESGPGFSARTCEDKKHGLTYFNPFAFKAMARGSLLRR